MAGPDLLRLHDVAETPAREEMLEVGLDGAAQLLGCGGTEAQ